MSVLPLHLPVLQRGPRSAPLRTAAGVAARCSAAVARAEGGLAVAGAAAGSAAVALGVTGLLLLH